MTDTIIFDFGDIFINLRHDLVAARFAALGLHAWNPEMQEANRQFEMGRISDDDYLSTLTRFATPGTAPSDVRDAWNTILGDFPRYRLEFLQSLSKQYRLFLLSNTDAIHIRHFEEREGESFIKDFYGCFEKTYFSFEMGMRKPDESIFSYILDRHQLVPERTLFVDDRSDNTDAAARLGLRTWNLQVGREDVVELRERLAL
ncbi:MAG TPA: HAD family phosphatase [Flavobacterium sp.]|nr:HAD family phosphatase [Flavobacterium sp.]